MHYHPDRNLNTKALLYTTFICAGIFMALFFFQWALPIIPKPLLEEGIEVNLGSTETGVGTISNLEEAPANSSNQATNSNPTQAETNSVPEVNPITSEDGELPEIAKPAIAKKTNLNNPLPIQTPVRTITPKPKAIFQPGSSKIISGNTNTDSYQPNQQGINVGKGDQGKPSGNPNSASYQGNANSGNQGRANQAGVSIRSGLDGRRITKLPSFEDDFNENAKVAIDIVVDPAGTVISATVNQRGTTTTNSSIRSIAIRKAKSIKLSSSSNTETGTLVFNFKLQE